MPRGRRQPKPEDKVSSSDDNGTVSLFSDVSPEVGYIKALHALSDLGRDEDARLVRVQMLLYKHGQDVARDEWQSIEKVCESLHRKMRDMEESLTQTTSKYETGLKDVESLTTQLATLQKEFANSGKTVSNQGDRSREITLLQKEVRQLKSQNETMTTIAAEKSKIEKQLEATRSEFQTAQEKLSQSENTQDGATTREHPDQMKKELGKEKRARMKLERKKTTKTEEWQREKAAMEQTIKTLQNKSKGPKTSNQGRKSKPREDMTPSTLAPAFDAEGDPGDKMTIETPGGVVRKPKTKRTSALPGEKSTFSMTPYLKRTTFLDSDPGNQTKTRPGRPRAAQPRNSGHDEEDILGSSPFVPRVSNGSRSSAREASLNGPDEGSSHSSSNPAPEASKAGSNNNPFKPIKRQRMLSSGRETSLFDDDEDDDGLQIGPAAVRKRIQILNNRTGPQFQGYQMGFNSISPRKRDVRII